MKVQNLKSLTGCTSKNENLYKADYLIYNLIITGIPCTLYMHEVFPKQIHDILLFSCSTA